jgi:hypothetical protein
MSRERILRRALWAATAFNLGGAILFGFPATLPGQLAGLPATVPAVYRALTALFVLLFGGAYAWLASQPSINRPFVAFGAIGKAAAFLVVFLLWLSGEASLSGVGIIGGDLALAGLFAWCLLGTQTTARTN